MTDQLVCRGCGQVTGVEAYDEALWDIYSRLRDGRSTNEALVFTGDWIAENVLDEDDHAAMIHAMETDMHRRGLCVVCGRPDLTGVTADEIMSEEDAREMHEMWAEQAAERRAGC